MDINTWWDSDRRERYWLEITDRDDLGTDLHAPQVDGRGRPNWTYELVRHVEPGDVVLHWHKNLLGHPAIVGYSDAVGPVAESSIVWNAHGTAGRERGPSNRAVTSWLFGLRDYKPLAMPVDQDDLRQVEPQLRALKAQMDHTIDGSLYFPLAFSDKRPVRIAQGYLVKLPAALLTAVPGLAQIPTGARRSPGVPGAGEKPTNSGSSRSRRSARGAGYVADAVLRRTLETHAVGFATAHYQRHGWTVEDVGSRESYDLRLTGDGRLERHVEVKGTTQDASEVELTTGEVRHSREAVPSDLYVVDLIHYAPDGIGGYTSWGGRKQLWENWSADERDLKPTRYRYSLPGFGRLLE